MRFVQLSDPHIVVPEKQPIHGRDTLHHLRCAVKTVNGLDPAPEFVLLTGDLTNDELPGSYSLVKAVLSDLRMPCHLALGNHDARRTFREFFLAESNPTENRYYYTFWQGDRRFIVLDSLDEGKVPGLLDEEQIRWLAVELVANPQAPTVVCLHHPPVPIGVKWLDELMLQNPEALLALLDAHTCVQLVLCGHVHQPTRLDRNHYTIMTSPAVSVQFRPEPLPPPAERLHSIISEELPAFRIFDFTDGVWLTTEQTVSLT